MSKQRLINLTDATELYFDRAELEVPTTIIQPDSTERFAHLQFDDVKKDLNEKWRARQGSNLGPRH